MPSIDTPDATGGPEINTRLKRASGIVEDCAFLAAGQVHADLVAQLILIAADLERLAEAFATDPPGQGDPQG